MIENYLQVKMMMLSVVITTTAHLHVKIIIIAATCDHMVASSPSLVPMEAELARNWRWCDEMTHMSGLKKLLIFDQNHHSKI